MFKSIFMEKALEQAKLAYQYNEVPIGAVIVDNITRNIISTGYNCVEKENNATFHAEIIAINKACAKLNSKYLMNYSIYTTLEPCAMCSAAIAHVKLHSLFYAASDFKHGAVENGIRFFNNSNCLYRLNIYPDILQAESKKLLKEFFSKIRIEK